MWRTLAALLLFVGALVLASRFRFPATPAAPVRTRAALERVVDAYVKANLDGDTEALVALYADDALLLPPDEGLVEGREAIAAFWAEGIEAGLALTPIRVEAEGSTGLVVGRYTVPAQGEAPADSGKCVLMLKRIDGAWRITADIWNSSSPRAEATPSPFEQDRGDSVKIPVRFAPARTAAALTRS